MSLLLETRRPVEDHGQRRARRLIDDGVDEEALAIGGVGRLEHRCVHDLGGVAAGCKGDRRTSGVDEIHPLNEGLSGLGRYGDVPLAHETTAAAIATAFS